MDKVRKPNISILAVQKTQICLGKCLLFLQMLQEIGALLDILNSGSSKENDLLGCISV
jgi:hypothetical protein